MPLRLLIMLAAMNVASCFFILDAVFFGKCYILIMFVYMLILFIPYLPTIDNSKLWTHDRKTGLKAAARTHD